MSTISIIGSGTMATTIGGRAAKAGHTVEVIGRDAAKAEALAAQLGGGATTGKYGEVPAGEIVILAVLSPGAVGVVTEFGDALDGKVIVDITNPMSADLTSVVTPDGTSRAQEIAEVAPAGAHVVKAFNTLFSQVLARGEHLDVFIAADDAEAKARVSAFVESLGLRSLDAGALAMARSLEAAGLLVVGVARNGAGFDIALSVEAR
jgi:predicted dinucleotide-binding enzyme